MADSRGDAPGKSRGTATGDKPERPNARGRNRQTGASSDQSASASTTMSANVGALLRLCESVLPPGLCAAASNGTHTLPSLAAISDRIGITSERRNCERRPPPAEKCVADVKAGRTSRTSLSPPICLLLGNISRACGHGSGCPRVCWHFAKREINR